MKRLAFLILATAISSTAAAADPQLVDGVSGAPIVWSDWVAKRGPVAVLVWASWAPQSASVAASYQAFAKAGREAGLHMVLLDVQEPLADGRKALSGSSVNWIHDRHGALLKQYRVITVPSVIVISADGELQQRLEATPEALRAGAGH
jgi:CheY-like chemotaxis protein